MKRVCVIGSSYLGAVFKAYEQRRPDTISVDFFGNGRMSFGLIDVADGHVSNIRFFNTDNRKLADTYDAFFIYGDMPSPQDLAVLERASRKAGHSAQLIAALKEDTIRATETWRLLDKLGKAVTQPIHVLSCNVMLNAVPLKSEDEYTRNVTVLKTTLGQGYHEFPRQIFNDDFTPRADYYKDSVYLDGQAADPQKHANHDLYHMNPTGGGVILDSMIAAVS
ncbi:hypothetical protein [Asticcacaulis solisilvae]|uniref:hypothetical protein n=1 Tax=Asticcacaulis solisilvae TaxID=1217274 RepID=UPI003FD82CB1